MSYRLLVDRSRCPESEVALGTPSSPGRESGNKLIHAVSATRVIYRGKKARVRCEVPRKRRAEEIQPLLPAPRSEIMMLESTCGSMCAGIHRHVVASLIISVCLCVCMQESQDVGLCACLCTLYT